MSPDHFSLQDKYVLREGRVALTGIQALVRLPMDQHRRDLAAGLRVGTYISGYQGSPLGELDKQLRLAGPLLEEHHIRFEPGINEDVAATAIYGSQLLEQFPHDRYDGVVGIWYGKAPGVDRSGDAFRHGQYIGTGRHGGVLMLAGDDPAAKSSTLPCDSTVALFDTFFPMLYPANAQEVLEYGLHGLALSRYCGLFAALKIVTNVADGGGIVEVSPDMARAVLPDLEIGGKPFRKQQLTMLMPPVTLEWERQIFYERLVAARAYARANRLDRITVRGAHDRIGLLSMGKAYLDLLLALELLGLNEAALQQAGVRIYKLGMISPIEPEGLTEFAQGLEELLMVEEKRGFIEMQVRDALYNVPGRPAVYGKFDREGRPLFPMHGELQPAQIARVLADYLADRLRRPDLRERVRWLAEIQERTYEEVMPRTPYFCSGCPHNTSTNLLEGDVTGGGIGCHAMASYMHRGVMWLTHMGGEGGPWIGLRHFTEQQHIFQNVGDGTYFHSASKAVEAAIAAGAHMTYKILYNSAVAMTGGQQVHGMLDPVHLALQLEAEGMRRVTIVAEDASKYPEKRISPTVSVRPKADYNDVMRELKAVPGVTAIIFDQQCAAEKRRQRKRGILATPRKRVYINESVCEGCGDCGVKSNCLSVTPIDTPYGRKTQIHQSSCNMDYSCLQGDCPSFMTVELGPQTALRRKLGAAGAVDEVLPEPRLQADAGQPYKMLLVGIGGTGVVTVDALLVTAAAIEGKFALHLDQTGLAQKGGAVVSNLILSARRIERPAKISAGETDLLLAFDLLASVAKDNLERFHPERTVAVVNTHRTSTAAVVTNIHAQFPAEQKLLERLHRYTNREGTVAVDAERLTEALFGNNQFNNIFLLGVAYQAGLLPLSAASIEEAVRANGVLVEQNVTAFRWGRKYRLDADAVHALAGDLPAPADPRTQAMEKLRRFAPARVEDLERLAADFPGAGRLDALLYPRVADLMLYQHRRLARTYLERVRQAMQAEHERTPGRTGLAEAVARGLFKLLAYKDEYEVARLLLEDPTMQHVRDAYEGPLTIYYHLHPPLLRAMGLKTKLRLGPWFTPLFRLLYALRGLRGMPLDPFGYARVRRQERRLIRWYTGLLDEVAGGLSHDNHATAVAIADAPEGIRGYESIKERMIAETTAHVDKLLDTLRNPKQERMAG